MTYYISVPQPTFVRLQLIIPQVCTGESHPVLHITKTDTFTGASFPPTNDEIDFLFNVKFFKFLFFMVINFKLDIKCIKKSNSRK